MSLNWSPRRHDTVGLKLQVSQSGERLRATLLGACTRCKDARHSISRPRASADDIKILGIE